MAGRIEVITGPMFSGKSEELIRRLQRHKIAGRDISVIKPHLDDRYEKDFVTSHSGAKWRSYGVDALAPQHILSYKTDVIGVDEAQFFDPSLADYLIWLANQGTIVIVTGLDTTYRREPFGCMPRLLAVADRVVKLTAICAKCGSDDGVCTQRLHDGVPASFKEDTIVVGGLETYEARCRDCYEKG